MKLAVAIQNRKLDNNDFQKSSKIENCFENILSPF